MIVTITREGPYVQAMGHRVALHLGGEPELRRRVLSTIAQLDAPPDEVRFERAERASPEAVAAEPVAGAPAPAPPKGEAPDKPPPRRRR